MRERKKTGMHGTNSRMNIIETKAVLNIIKTDGKCAPEAKREDLESNIEESNMDASWPSVGKVGVKLLMGLVNDPTCTLLKKNGSE